MTGEANQPLKNNGYRVKVDTGKVQSAQDLDYSTIPKQQRWNTTRYITVGFGVAALFSLFVSLVGSSVYASEDPSVFVSLFTLFVFANNLLLIPLMIATFVSGVIMMLTTRDYLSKYLLGFTTSNGFTLQANTYAIHKDGSIFSVGDNPSESNIITGIYRGFDFELLQHKYWTGSGKNRTQHGLTLLNLKLPKKVPHIVIDSKIEDATAYSGSVLPVMFSRDQKLTLEGDFSKYFDVYSPRNYQVSALALMTPDVMQTFLTKLHQVDIELINDRLYIYDPDLMNSAEQIQDMFEAADAIIDEWSDKLKRANIYATKHQEQINIGEKTETVKLKRGGLIATIVGVIIIITIYGLRIIAETTDDVRFVIPLFALVPIVLVAIIIRQIIVAQRRTSFTKRYGKIKD